MGRPAVLLCALAACGGARSGGSAIGNRAAGGQDLTASYQCSIESDGFRYPAFPCAIRDVDGKYVLAKLAGSQRFRGEVRPSGDGFSFDGEFFCPTGDCTSPMHGQFVRRADGSLVGKFAEPSIVVTLQPAAGDAYGGAAYGGDPYGGFGYGGAEYGGRRNRR